MNQAQVNRKPKQNCLSRGQKADCAVSWTCIAEFTSSPPAERASREQSSSADRPPVLLASSLDPSHICAPPGSAPPAGESEKNCSYTGCHFFFKGSFEDICHTLAWSSCKLSTGLVSSSFLAIISWSICFRYRPMISSSAYWCSSRDNHSSAKTVHGRAICKTSFGERTQYEGLHLFSNSILPLFSCCSSLIWVFSWVRRTWGLYLVNSWISELSSRCWQKRKWWGDS